MVHGRLFLLLLTFGIFVSSCQTLRMSKDMYAYMKTGDFFVIAEEEKRPIIIPPSSTTNPKEDEYFLKAHEVIMNMGELEKQCDLGLIEYYSDKAYVQYTRKDSKGRARKGAMVWKGGAIKELHRKYINICKEQNDYSEYSNFSFAHEGDKVRVGGIRYSNRYRTTSPISWLVGPEDGRWVILEEISEHIR